MPSTIQTIKLTLPFRMGSVNCFLIKVEGGFVLIDTGTSEQRAGLEKALVTAGCHPDNLKLIILTHGDFDHAGNAAHLSREFGAPVAIHASDAGMVEWGNMFVGRKKSNPFLNWLSSNLFGFGKSKRFKPNLLIDEEFDLDLYGIEAQILHIPGHSAGSIGILLPGGELICGDLFENVKTPALNSIMDDLGQANASVEKLRAYKIHTIYPGHGEAFNWEEFINSWDQ